MNIEEINYSDLRKAIIRHIDTKGFREKISLKFGSASANAIDVLKKVITQGIYYLEESPEHKGWFFSYTDKINQGLNRDRKTITKVLAGLREMGYLEYFTKRKIVETYRLTNPGLDRLLSDNKHPGRYETPYFIYVNLTALTADIKPSKAGLTGKEKSNYYQGMQKERDWHSIKETRENFEDPLNLYDTEPQETQDNFTELKAQARIKELNNKPETIEPEIKAPEIIETPRPFSDPAHQRAMIEQRLKQLRQAE